MGILGFKYLYPRFIYFLYLYHFDEGEMSIRRLDFSQIHYDNNNDYLRNCKLKEIQLDPPLQGHALFILISEHDVTHMGL